MTIQNRVNLADFVSNSKKRKLLNQNLFPYATYAQVFETKNDPDPNNWNLSAGSEVPVPYFNSDP